MQSKGEVFSLWVGGHAQQLAHHFYALQAQQFFDQQQDPLNHNYIWKLIDKNGQRKKPYFLTFDTEIPHLNHLRHTNHAKMISEMEKSNMGLEDYFFSMDYKPKEKQQIPEEKETYLYQRWQAAQNNYVVIDKNFVQDCQSFQFWKDIFKMNSDNYEDRIRKQLENFDVLQNITLTSDLEKAGFSQQIIIYLKDECPKNDIVFFQLQTVKEDKTFYEVTKMTTLSEIGSLVDSFFSFKVQNPEYQYFQTDNPYIHLAPLMNSILTPLFLKTRTPGNFMSNILVNPRRNLFDIAYTLPLIDKNLNLSRTTNIFDYLQTNRHEKFFQAQQSSIKVENHQEQVYDMYYENKNTLQKQGENPEIQIVNRINYGANYLQINLKKKQQNALHFYKKEEGSKQKQKIYQGLLSQSYVLKGHIKHFEKVFEPNCQLLDFKYLQGILCNYTQNKAKYNKNYVKYYGQQVQNYPFHCVTFQHQQFSTYLRKLSQTKNKKNVNELQSEWRQNILTQADLYKQNVEQDDD